MHRLIEIGQLEVRSSLLVFDFLIHLNGVDTHVATEIRII